MNKIYRFILILLSLVIIALVLLSFLKAEKSENIIRESVAYSDTEKFIVKEYKGSIAVFRYGNDTPIQILDCKINSLPPNAAKALATGIEVIGDEELQKIIEAYD